MREVPPTPPSRTLAQIYLNKFVNIRIDSRREVKPRFCSRERWVAKRRCGNEKHHGVVFEPHRDRAAARPTETLPIKKVVLHQIILVGEGQFLRSKFATKQSGVCLHPAEKTNVYRKQTSEPHCGSLVCYFIL